MYVKNELDSGSLLKFEDDSNEFLDLKDWFLELDSGSLLKFEDDANEFLGLKDWFLELSLPP